MSRVLHRVVNWTMLAGAFVAAAIAGLLLMCRRLHKPDRPHQRPTSHPMLRRALIWSIPAILLITAGIVTYLQLTGPRMFYQANLRPHQAIMPELPTGTVPVRPILFPAPTTQEARSLINPLPPTPENLARGRMYYDYYCVFCHDTNGSGSAEVGRSYMPAPSDLRDARLGRLGDGEYLQRSLTGEGHAPVLEQVIPPEYRWYVILYARQFTRNSSRPE